MSIARRLPVLRVILVLIIAVIYGPALKADVITSTSTIRTEPMTFEVQSGACLLSISCERWVAAKGKIAPGSPQRLRALLDRLPNERILVAFDSPGGDYYAAIAMGRLLRERTLPTTVAGSSTCDGKTCKGWQLGAKPGMCDFACLVAFSGGIQRTISRTLVMKMPRLLHPEDLPSDFLVESSTNDGGLLGAVDNYFSTTSISPDLVITMISPPRQEWHWLTAEQSVEGRVATAYYELSTDRKRIIVALASREEPEMTFSLQHGTCTVFADCKNWIAAKGRVMSRSAEKLAALLDSFDSKGIPIALDSAGGSYASAIELGNLIRKRNLPVTVARSNSCDGVRCFGWRLAGEEAQCDFACVLVFMGGSRQSVPVGLSMKLPRLREPKFLSAGFVVGTAEQDYGHLEQDLETYFASVSIKPPLRKFILRPPQNLLVTVSSKEMLNYGLKIGTYEDPSEDVSADLTAVASLAFGGQRPMSFSIHESAACAGKDQCPRWIAAEGVIGPETPDAFLNFLRKGNFKQLPIYLHSLGGDYEAALRLGEFARKDMFKVGVAKSLARNCATGMTCRRKGQRDKALAADLDVDQARCDFACVFFLAGGRERAVGPKTWITLPVLYVTKSDIDTATNQGLVITLDKSAQLDRLENKMRALYAEWSIIDGFTPGFEKYQQALTKPIGSYSLLRTGLVSRPDDPRVFIDLLKVQRHFEPTLSFEAPEMQFVVVRSVDDPCWQNCQRWIAAMGNITENSPAKLRKLLKSLGKQKLPIVIASNGGSVRAAMELGLLIRRARLDVGVGRSIEVDCGDDCRVEGRDKDVRPVKLQSDFSYCSSACPLVLAGGVRRFSSPWSSLMVHSPFTIVEAGSAQSQGGSAGVVEASSFIRRPIVAYLKVMGVDPSLYDLMRSAAPQSFRLVTPDEALALHLTTHKLPALAMVDGSAD